MASRKPWFYHIGPLGLWIAPSPVGLLVIAITVAAGVTLGYLAHRAFEAGHAAQGWTFTGLFGAVIVGFLAITTIKGERG